MLSINTNLSSLITQRSMRQSTNKLNQAIERMTTGAKINHAKDNAANYNIVSNMTTKMSSLQVAEDNCAMGLDMLATANGTLDQIHDKLQRLRDLATQASNGTYGEDSLKAINSEANALVDEIERIYNTTEYNGINLMKGQVSGTEESKFIKDIDRRDTSNMTTLASVEIDKALEVGTYSISTPDELAKLATMTNNGLIGAGCEFVLGADIDLQTWCNTNLGNGGWTPIGNTTNKFKAHFDGNGYLISNLHINRAEGYQGLFGYTENAVLENIGIENVNISLGSAADKKYNIGALSGIVLQSYVTNCYTIGEIDGKTFGIYVGGLIGQALASSKVKYCYSECNISNIKWDTGGLLGVLQRNSELTDSYATGNISNGGAAGGLVGYCIDKFIVRNCFSTGTINCRNSAGLIAATHSGGLIENVWTTSLADSSDNSCAGLVYKPANVTIRNAYVLSENDSYKGIISALHNAAKGGDVIIENCYYSSFYDSLGIPVADFSEAKIKNVNSYNGTTPFNIENHSEICKYNSNLTLQIGTNSDKNSTLNFNIATNLGQIDIFRAIGLENHNVIEKLDIALNNFNNKSVNLGAIQNRLESALEEISTQYENLASSRSTLQDADIAEVSSEYIRQQILQQASATLMATANQSASIALSLI